MKASSFSFKGNRKNQLLLESLITMVKHFTNKKAEAKKG